MRLALLLSCALCVVVAQSQKAIAYDYPIGNPLETLNVPFVNNSTPSTVVLEQGVQYWLLSEGVVSAGHSGQLSDAEWWYDAEGTKEWYHEADFTGYPPHTGDLIIDEQGYDWWGSALPSPNALIDFATFEPLVFSPSHMYWIPIIGDGTSIDLRIVDHPSHYHDNSGSLTVGIYNSVPEPGTAAFLIFGGIALAQRWRKHCL